MALSLCLHASGQVAMDGLCCLQVPHHAIQNVSFNWDDHDKFLPGEAPCLAPSVLIVPRLNTQSIANTPEKLPAVQSNIA